MTSPSAPLPQAVLWDLDGTLIDSEPLWMAAEGELMAAHGLGWSDEQGRAMVGNALPVSAGLMQEAGLPLGLREIIDTLIDAVMQGLRENVPWRPGVRELMEALGEAGVPQALVTMSERPMADAVMQGLGSSPFSVVVTGDAVERGKPDPEPYLKALDELAQQHPGVIAAGSLALEDSVPGTSSALAAGLVTVGVPLHVPLTERDGLILLPTLAGVTPQELGCLVQLAQQAGEPQG